jgi:hypothetical protein
MALGEAHARAISQDRALTWEEALIEARPIFDEMMAAIDAPPGSTLYRGTTFVSRKDSA